ncbi:phosphoglycolate phosphatase [Yoonia tamlensis]|uniref:phosphoglycolate phosphatase n=1 Tax=Yoonia tamlensis TaxID=390270 RepID=A0A1I6FWA5_9RHOB|nr:HAD family hydrolase [Yoonia tamlensis]SFR34166.1 phosphoglycolate phosphatase [Yoonia tamlensis]
MIKGIIFDKDGTLFDFNATWGAWTRQMLAAETGDDPARLATLADALGYDVAANRFRPGSIVIASTVDVVADHILSVLGPMDKPALIARMNAGAAQVTQQEAVPLVAYFSALKASGLTLGIATNDAEAPALRHLERAGVRDHFNFVAGYDSGYGAKPAPGQLHGFCAQTGIAAEDCAMVGDSTHDLDAGRAAGMVCIGVLTGPAPRAELAPFADVVLNDIGAIPAWLRAEGLI